MTKNGANAMLMWVGGMSVGVGAAQGHGGLMVVGSIVTIAALFYFRRFCDQRD